MATRAHSTPIACGRRPKPASPAPSRERNTLPRIVPEQAGAIGAAGLDLTDYLPTFANRTKIAALAVALIDWLDATTPGPDMEPDHDGEEEQDCCPAADDDTSAAAARQCCDNTLIGCEEDAEASQQPATLAADWRGPRRLRWGGRS
jgi:hypothetical protein